MARASLQFVCQQCGSVFLKWAGRCEGCGQWNSLAEEAISSQEAKSKRLARAPSLVLVPLQNPEQTPITRMTCEMSEFDRVTGGGLVPGAVVLLGGDPGIGKSTLLLQLVSHLSAHRLVAYVSGEEGLNQIRLRAERLKVAHSEVKLASSTRIGDILNAFDHPETVSVLVVDSIQTMGVDEVEAAPGTVSQIRGCTQALIALAKKRGITVILVGHVTKEGLLAGPRLLEHMVDTVLYFEGERGHPFRLLRAVKNRFGPTDEIGVFDMTENGLVEVKNPSALFLSHRSQDVTGSCVFAGMEGTRPLLVEIQALVAPSFLTNPRRSAVGWDPQRLSMVMAVLEARCGLNFGGKDVYLSVLGGLKITEPAADLAVAAALLSCMMNKPLPRHLIAFGEISLSGEIRPVSQAETRLKEATKLGFQEALFPEQKGKTHALRVSDLELHALTHVHELVSWVKQECQFLSQ